MKAITIIAGGWSASQFNLEHLPGMVIAVNDAALYAPRVDVIVSMDRMWAEGRFKQVSLFGKPLWLRRKTLVNIDWRIHECVTPFENDHLALRLSDEPGRLDGGHSGFCALNLAYHLRPRDLYLVGFDMMLGPKGERHWFPDYPWKDGGGSKAGKLLDWAGQFKLAEQQLRAAGTETFICRTAGRSTVSAFKALSPTDLEARWRGA
jgi:hypothetical protein